MSHFSKEKTEIELFIVDNFNFEDENPYTSQIEEDGKFVQIKQIEKEKIDGDTFFDRQQPPIKQRK